MISVVSGNPSRLSSFPLSSPHFLLQFPSLARKYHGCIHFSYTKRLYGSGALYSSNLTASSSTTSTSFGGWDDPRLGSDWDWSGESNQFRYLLAAVGIDDKKYMIMFLLGMACALAVSRLRVSSTVVFPAFVIVFAVGFSFGFIRSQSSGEVAVIQSKRKVDSEKYRVSIGKLRILSGFLDEVDSKVNQLMSDVKRAINTSQITVGDLEKYVGTTETISSLASDAKNVLSTSVDHLESVFMSNVGDSAVLLVDNHKPSKKRKAFGDFNLFQIIGNFLGGDIKESNKVKQINKPKALEMQHDNPSAEKILATPINEEKFFKPGNHGRRTVRAQVPQNIASKPAKDKSRVDRYGDRVGRFQNGNEKMDSPEVNGNNEGHSASNIGSYINNRLQFMNNHACMKPDTYDKISKSPSHDDLFDSHDFGLHSTSTESGAFLRQEHIFHKLNGGYAEYHTFRRSKIDGYGSSFSKERVNLELSFDEIDDYIAHEDGIASFSSIISDDILFDRYLKEANGLLKQARVYSRAGGNKQHAEMILYKSAKLLSKAITLKPMSLLALGKLGNTYLLHGELKLKISHELKTLLLKSDSSSVEEQYKALWEQDDHVVNKDTIASILVDVSKECEELFVEAGRKYKLALSIDGNDVRALYNWGLALSFRAQLIANIGPQAAYDADKMFLAAIDKFDAVMSKGNTYLPDALFRWAAALQYRSQLRPSNSRERVKLLRQAKRLYEDALLMDSGNAQIKEALSMCISELKFGQLS